MTDSRDDEKEKAQQPVAWAIVEPSTNIVISAFPDEQAAISARPSMDHDTIPLYAAPSAIGAIDCKHPKTIDGYEGGYDMSWCDDCGEITRCSDGLIPRDAIGRNSRSEWCARRVIAFGCEREVGGGELCKTWCTSGGCPVSIRPSDRTAKA